MFKIFSRKVRKDKRKDYKVLFMDENELSYKIIGAAIEIHKTIGPGLLESAYENALAFDLRNLGFNVKQQVAMPFIYKGIKQDVGYRIDLLVNNKVIIEVNQSKS